MTEFGGGSVTAGALPPEVQPLRDDSRQPEAQPQVFPPEAGGIWRMRHGRRYRTRRDRRRNRLLAAA